MLRLAWAACSNEEIFLFQATTLVFFNGFPAWQQRDDALYYARYFAEKALNPFAQYPILAGFFIALMLTVADILGLINFPRNWHRPQQERARLRLRLNLIR